MPGLPRSVGFLPIFFPPEPCLAHPAVGTLPLPLDVPEFFAFAQEAGPDPLHHAVVAPALEPAVDGAVRAELLGQAVPLAATAEAVDDAIEQGPPIPGRLSALGAGLPILPEDGFNASPEVIRDLPDGIQRLGLGTLPWHEGVPLGVSS